MKTYITPEALKEDSLKGFWSYSFNMWSSTKLPTIHENFVKIVQRMRWCDAFIFRKLVKIWGQAAVGAKLQLGPSCSWGQAAGYQPRPQAGG